MRRTRKTAQQHVKPRPKVTEPQLLKPVKRHRQHRVKTLRARNPHRRVVQYTAVRQIHPLLPHRRKNTRVRTRGAQCTGKHPTGEHNLRARTQIDRIAQKRNFTIVKGFPPRHPRQQRGKLFSRIKPQPPHERVQTHPQLHQLAQALKRSPRPPHHPRLNARRGIPCIHIV